MKLPMVLAFLVVSEMVFSEGDGCTDSLCCDKIRKRTVESCQAIVAYAKMASDFQADGVKETYSKDPNMYTSAKDFSDVGRDAADRYRKARDFCQDMKKKCEESCNPSKALDDPPGSQPTEEKNMRTAKGKCEREIAPIRNQAAAGVNPAQTARVGGQETGAQAGGAPKMNSNSGLNPMSLLPLAMMMASKQQQQAQQPAQTAQMAQSTVTPASLDACQGPGALTNPNCNKVAMVNNCRTPFGSGNCNEEGFRAVQSECKPGGNLNPNSPECDAVHVASVCRDIGKSGGSLPESCGGTRTAADASRKTSASLDKPKTNSNSSAVNGANGGAGAVAGLNGSTIASLNPSLTEKKGKDIREGMSLAVDGGGGGPSGSSNDPDDALMNAANRVLAGGPAAARAAGLAMAHASFPGDVSTHGVTVMSLVGEVYHKRCLAGKFLHCGPQ